MSEGLVTHMCISKMGNQCFRSWLAACSAPTRCITNRTNLCKIQIKIQQYLSINCMWKHHLKKYGTFYVGLNVLIFGGTVFIYPSWQLERWWGGEGFLGTAAHVWWNSIFCLGWPLPVVRVFFSESNKKFITILEILPNFSRDLS